MLPRRGSCRARARRWTVLTGLPVSAGLFQPCLGRLRSSALGNPPPPGEASGMHMRACPVLPQAPKS